MNRLNLTYKMETLLENCRSCPLENEYVIHPDIRCGHCPTYSELREIGKELDKDYKPTRGRKAGPRKKNGGVALENSMA
ncbi:hypothetical protein A8F94_17330 [Bacillus sp. FJAT-27225]|uniref:hypothetical protein n=1 Tax=Bacillus sp. FJAT-27225 TaxID=1743144 RepID=UPI00080C2FDB|nr:hypothetical protein [Bacillus sp. FJAT-27225]OCA84460.1 hypothetical protein A8F94_17330 [Bacillus sp. FJAT-27225]